MLWSDKVGYIFISVDPIRRTVADSDSWAVECAEDLLDKLLYEMAVDFMESDGHTLDPKETGDSLHDKLSMMGGPLLLKTIDQLEDGSAVRIPQ